jgi:superfamily II DNA or RNA helicase
MNKNLEPIYTKINGKISQQIVKTILGDTASSALVLFEREYYRSENVFDEARLLLESLQNTALSNQLFVEILIMDLLDIGDLNDLISILNLHDSPPNFETRRIISKMSKAKKTNALVKLFKVDVNYFIAGKSVSDSVSHEIVTPYSPININDPQIDIPKEYLILHDYQKRVKDTSTKMLLDSDIKKFMIHMPTGSGKTKTCVESIIDYMRTVISSDGYVVWFAHSKELCDQAYETLKNMWRFRGDEAISFYKVFGDADIDLNLLSQERAVLFIGFQKFNSLLESTDQNILRFRTRIASKSKLIVVDEAHKSMAPTYKNAINYCQSNFINCKLIGLTATPGRTNEDSEENNFLANFFDNNLIVIKDVDGVEQSNPVAYLQGENVLANINETIIEIDMNLKSRLLVSAEELSVKQLEEISKEAVINPLRNIKILETVKERISINDKESILIFAASTEHCIVLDIIFKREKISSEYILGTTSKDDRERIIREFKEKKFNVLINYSVLTTGFDAPQLNTLIIARTVNSNILGSQIIGRALRGKRNGGNSENNIIVFKDNISGLDPSFLFSYWESFWGKKI